MIRFMLDSDQPAELIKHRGAAAIYATYSDLIPDAAAFAKLRAELGGTLVLIDRGLGDPTGLASIADLEPGAMWPLAKFPPWYDAKAKAGVPFITGYLDRAELSGFKAVLGTRKPYHWIATLDGTAAIPGYLPLRTPAAVQCFRSTELGIHADGSLVLEPSWHPSPAVLTLRGKLGAAIASNKRELAELQAADTLLAGLT